MKDTAAAKKLFWFLFVRILFRISVAFLAFILTIVLVLNVPAVQTFVTGFITKSVKKKIGTEFTIGSVKISFPKTVKINEIYLAGQHTDTLLYLRELRINIDLFKIFTREIDAKNIGIVGMVTHINRKAPSNDFNFQFIINAFSSADTLPHNPKTAATNWFFNVRDIELRNVRAKYFDELAGINANFNLALASVEFKNIDIVRNEFHANEIDIKSATAFMERWEVQNPDKPAGNPSARPSLNAPQDTVLPEIGIVLLCLENIHVRYVNKEALQDFSFDLGLLRFSPKTIDLNKRNLDLGELFLNKASLKAAMALQDTNAETVGASADSVALFPVIPEKTLAGSIFPDWDIRMDNLEMNKTELKFDDVSTQKIPSGLDYRHLHITEMNVETGKISVSSAGMIADINNISFTEQSGLHLKKLQGKVELNDKFAKTEDLEIETSMSNILGDIRFGFNSLENLQTDLGQTEISLDLKKFELNTRDIFLFMPGLASDSLFIKYPIEKITAGTIAGGKINLLNFDHLEIRIFDNTRLNMHGRVTGLPETARFGFDLAIDSLSTTLADLSRFIHPAMVNGISLPGTYLLNGTASGKMDSISTEIYVHTDFGDISTEGFYQDFVKSRRDTFNIAFEAKDLFAGKILSDSIYGNLSLTGKIDGSGAGSDSIAARVEIALSEAEFYHYTYKSLEARGRMNGEVFSANMISGDPNIRFDLSVHADLKDQKQKFTSQINIGILDLAALNFSSDEFVISTSLSATANYTSPENMDANIRAMGTKLSKGNVVVPVKLLEINALVTNDSLSAELKSDLLDASVSGNFVPKKLPLIMQAMFNKYLGVADSTGVTPGNRLAFGLDLHLPENVRAMLLKDFDKLDINEMKGGYTSDNNELYAKMRVNEIVYKGFNLDTLSIRINGKSDSVAFDFDLRKISYDTIQIENLSIREAIHKGNFISEVRIDAPSGVPRYLFLNKIEFADSALTIGFLPAGLILNGDKWSVPENNFLEFGNSGIRVKNFLFSHQEESVGIHSGLANTTFAFTNFGILNIFNIVEFTGREKFVKGNLDGQISFSDKKNLLTADLKIDKLFLLDTLLGNFSFKAKADSSLLNLGVNLKNDQNNIVIGGNILHWDNSPEFDLNVLLDISNLHRIERFTLGLISEMSGKVDGQVTITGTLANPAVNGFIGFDETVMKINSLNLLTRFRNEKITLDKHSIRFTDFTIEDEQQQKLKANGSISTENYSNFNFDLQFSAKNFQSVNSTNVNNRVFFGKMFMDADVKLKGNSNIPVIDATLKINKGTDLTYALPGSELQLITSEGIVHFVDHTSMNDTMFIEKTGNYFTDSIISNISGTDLSANLEVDPEAKFTVLIDPKSGDYLTLIGSANLSITVDQSGNQTMTGTYEVKSGIYQLSFYGLVKKSFTIKSGSNVSWSGKPMDASLAIVAAYDVTTTSVSLVANETTSMSESEKSMYKQRLPYTVLLNINGFLAKPEISFNITLPDKYMVNYPQVATKLAQLNTEEMTSERNKQVFALLVTGSFIANNPFASTGSSTTNIATTAARNSVNGILADQLNKISNKYVKGVDLNFGLTSYEDYRVGSSETRTELGVQVTKKLMNDRLTIEAQGSIDVEGSKKNSSGQTSQQMLGEFAVIYSLTADGEYKLRAYRENAYDLFDGEVAYSGIAFIFEKEFDSLKRKGKKSRDESRKTTQPNKEGIKSNSPQPENK